jgi:hypothetical protein
MAAMITITPSSGVVDPAPVHVFARISSPSRSTITTDDGKPLDPKVEERSAYLVGLRLTGDRAAGAVTIRQVA